MSMWNEKRWNIFISCVPRLLFSSGQQQFLFHHLYIAVVLFCIVCFGEYDSIWIGLVCFAVCSAFEFSAGTFSLALCARRVLNDAERTLQTIVCIWWVYALCGVLMKSIEYGRKSTCYSVNHFWAPSHIDKNEAYLGRGQIWFHSFDVNLFNFWSLLILKTCQIFKAPAWPFQIQTNFKPIIWVSAISGFGQ